MTTITDHVYTVKATGAAADVALPLQEDSAGEITIDSSRIPYVEASITVAVVDPLIIDSLDPRDSRRVAITAARDGGSPRTFDLGIRSATPNHEDGTVTLQLASDEASLSEYASMFDDRVGPWARQSSLREICEYVLSQVPGVARNLEPNSRALSTGSTAPYGARNGWTRTFVTTGSPPPPPAPASVVRFSAPSDGTFSLGIDSYGNLGQTAPGMTGDWVAGPRVTPGQTITVSRWIRLGGNSTPFRVYVRFHDGAGNWLTGNLSGAASIPGYAGWSQPFWTGVVPAGAVYVTYRTQSVATQTVIAGAFMDTGAPMTEVTNRVRSWRERALEAGTLDADMTAYWAVTNLFTNPSFENTVAGWANGSLATGLAPTTTQKYVGNYSGHWQTTGAGSSFIDYAGPISVQQGRQYIFTALMRATVARPARLLIRFKNAAGVVLSDRYGFVTNLSTTQWDSLYNEQIAPPGATQVTLHIEYQASAAGQFPYVDALLFYEGDRPVPYFDGVGGYFTPPGYTYAWTGAVNASTSVRTPNVARSPEALTWRAGVSGMTFLEPLLKSAGLRLVCDEQRRWSLRNAEYRAPGTQVYRYPVNIKSAEEELSRESEWYDAAVYEYIWPDQYGIEQRALDTYALVTPPTKVLHVQLRGVVFPGPGRAEFMVKRAQGRGRTLTVGAIPNWTEQTDQDLSITLDGTPVQNGISAAIRYDLANDTVTVTSRTVDTPTGSINLLVGTINALAGTIDNL